MSDTDDTDVLLLISPNHYVSSAEKKLAQQEFEETKRRQFLSLQELNDLKERLYHNEFNLSRYFQAMDLANIENDGLNMLPPPPPSLYQYEYLSSDRKQELRHINKQLHELQNSSNSNNGNNNEGGNLENPSDISSISMGTVRSNFLPSRTAREPFGILHSTPKCNSAFKKVSPQKLQTNVEQQNGCIDDGFLGEIDILLNDKYNRNEEYRRLPQHQQQEAQAQFNDENDHRVQEKSSSLNIPQSLIPINDKEENVNAYLQHHTSKTDNNLISLSDIWGRDGQATAIALPIQSNLKEEQLRRQHLEKIVRLLQSRLLEYQQRLSVAIEVDRAKDDALNNARIENNSLTQELQQTRAHIKDLEQQRKQGEEKMQMLDKELAQTVNLATKFQEKNEKLENELSNCSRKTNECTLQYKQQIEQLEMNIHASKRSEEMAIEEMHKIKDKYIKCEHLYEKSRLRCDELEKECNTLRNQKESLQEIQKKQRSRIDILENQKKSLQDSVNHLTEIETNLKKKLDLQQKSLKSHYQQQLEQVVAQKLKEFQEQLDKTEECLKSEARERERLIAERAVKQLELINEKNELELNLLQQKHTEEVELYRLQLANASKKIDDLEMKLNLYKSKRADIAEKLHNIMETQWRKALEILTSPNQTRSSNSIQMVDSSDIESPDNNETAATVTATTQNPLNTNRINNCENTPKSSKNKSNNLNLQNIKSSGKLSPVDKLQAYIELLLSKSPSDFDRLDEILSLTSKAKEVKEKLEKNAKRHCHNNKPPWKA